MTARKRFFWSVVSATALLLSLGNPARSARAEGNIDAQAMKSIERMSEFLTRAKQFSVTVDIGYDIVQEWGQKIEFGETRVVTVRRPDRLRIDTTDRDGSKSGVVFDGTDIAVFDLKDKVYATTAKPGSIDDTISYFINDLGMKLPMAQVLQSRLPQATKEWARDVRYAETATIAGVPCDHVALHGDWEDVQMWIASGDQPLLQRMVITYTRADGKPQFWAQLGKWNLSPDVPDSAFTFTPPEGAAKIAFKPRRLGPGATAEAKGGQP